MYLEAEAQEYLKKLGLTLDESSLYLSLVRNGPLPLLKASRYSGIERTKLYRMIGSLKDRGIIEEVMAHKRHVLKAASAERILSLVQSHQTELVLAQSKFPDFKHYMQSIQAPIQGTEVLYYEGVDGIRQMCWNSLEAKTMLRSYVDTVFNEMTGQKFLANWASEVVARGFKVHELRGPHFSNSLTNNKLDKVYLGKKYIHREAPKGLNLTHAMDIYNDTVSIYYWKGSEVLGVEIKNSAIARMQESIFDFFWIASST